jgi:branched-subunit amino acid ABC-type transport system permease component
MILAVIIALVLECLLRRSRVDVELRAVGSSEVRAARLGARITATILWAHVVCSLLAILAGLVLRRPARCIPHSGNHFGNQLPRLGDRLAAIAARTVDPGWGGAVLPRS